MIFLERTTKPEQVHDAALASRGSTLVLEVGIWEHAWTSHVHIPSDVVLTAGRDARDLTEGEYALITLAGARVDAHKITWVQFQSKKEADILSVEDCSRKEHMQMTRKTRRVITKAICDAVKLGASEYCTGELTQRQIEKAERAIYESLSLEHPPSPSQLKPSQSMVMGLLFRSGSNPPGHHHSILGVLFAKSREDMREELVRYVEARKDKNLEIGSLSLIMIDYDIATDLLVDAEEP